VGNGEGKGSTVGVVDEGFLEKIKTGDVFVLGGKKYQFMYTRGMKVYVRSGIKRNPTIPSWFSEVLPLSFDSALEIGKFRKMMNDRFEKKKTKKEIKEFIREYVYCEENVAEEIYSYFKEQFYYAKIPHEERILIEYYHGKKNNIIFHTLFGRRVNDALSRALGYLMGQKAGRDIEIGISDNGFYFAGENPPLEEAMKVLTSENMREVLEEAVNKTEILKRRFRHCAARSLMILKNYKGHQKTVGKQQMKSHFLLSAVNKLGGNFPILKEAKREVMEDLMDIKRAEQVWKLIKDKRIKIEKIETKLPSPFGLNLILQGHYDLLKMEDKLEFLKRMYFEYEKIIKEKENIH
jgi:ATP-dependent Lhr-like helicase